MSLWPRLAAVVQLSGLLAGLATAQPAAPPGWSPALAQAFAAYERGETQQVQHLAAEIGAASRDPRVQRDAAALAAMALLRGASRDEIQDGRGQLGMIAREDPSILERPEVELASGIAQSALSETAAALGSLNAAARAFIERRDGPRAQAALVALAQTWSRHGEWERMGGGADVPKPTSAAEARRIRIAEIEKLRARAEQTPETRPATERIDLVLARYLLDSDDTAADGRARLERLAASTQSPDVATEAALTLAGDCERRGAWDEALRLYDRLRGGTGEPAARAEKAAAAIRDAQIEIDAPATLAGGAALRVGLAVRNLTGVEIEVRRVDLPTWLESRRGVLSLAALPVEGAVVASAAVATASARPREWWRSPATGALSAELSPGAYVVVARAPASSGSNLVHKRLLLVSGIQAALITGGGRAAAWVSALGSVEGAQSSDAGAPAELRFWMQGSYVPTRVKLEGGVACFPLPGDARVLLERQWTCLIQSGANLAVCRGRLPTEEELSGSRATLVAGPTELRVGQTLYVAALAHDAPEPPTSEAVTLELRDVQDRTVHAVKLSNEGGGLQSGRIAIEPRLAGQSLGLVLKRGNRVLQSARGSTVVKVGLAETTPLLVNVRLPRWSPLDAPPAALQVRAVYPWGTPLADGRGSWIFRAVEFPQSGEGSAALATGGPIGERIRLDASGAARSMLAIAGLALPPGAGVYGAWGTAFSWEGPVVTASAQLLRAGASRELALRCEPGPVEGERRVRVNRYDAQGVAAPDWPTVEVIAAGTPLAALELTPAYGSLDATFWAGDTAEKLVARWQTPGEALERAVAIAPPQTAPATRIGPIIARLEQRGGKAAVRVTGHGRSAGPLLALLHDRDPLAAAARPPLDGELKADLPLSRPLDETLSVLICEQSPQGVRLLRSASVTSADNCAGDTRIDAPQDALQPGRDARVTVKLPDASGRALAGTALARLANDSEGESVDWAPGEARREPAGLTLPLRLSWSGDPDTAAGFTPLPGAQFAAPEAAALLAGGTLWTQVRPIENGQVSFDVPLPERPGRYRLWVVSRLGACGTRVASTLLDTTGRAGVTVDLPSRLSLGDRTVAGIALRSSVARRSTVAVSVETDEGLAIGAPRAVPARGAAEGPANANELLVPLEPDDLATIAVPIEAARTGAAALRVRIREPNKPGERTVTAQTAIVDAATPAAASQPVATPAPVLRLRRSVALLTEQPVISKPNSEPPARTSQLWQQTPLDKDGVLSPGQIVVVRDEFVVEAPLQRVAWAQPLPPVCRTKRIEGVQLLQIGTARPGPTDALTWDATALKAGRYLNEFTAVALRPGACVLPPPTITIDGNAIRVEVAPSDLRLVVSE